MNARIEFKRMKNSYETKKSKYENKAADEKQSSMNDISELRLQHKEEIQMNLSKHSKEISELKEQYSKNLEEGEKKCIAKVQDEMQNYKEIAEKLEKELRLTKENLKKEFEQNLVKLKVEQGLALENQWGIYEAKLLEEKRLLNNEHNKRSEMLQTDYKQSLDQKDLDLQKWKMDAEAEFGRKAEDHAEAGNSHFWRGHEDCQRRWRGAAMGWRGLWRLAGARALGN